MKEGNYSISEDAKTQKQANKERAETKLKTVFPNPKTSWGLKETVKEGIIVVILEDVFGEILVGRNSGRVQSCKE